MKQVIVRVPASTSNLGPGFDCLGVALRLYNKVIIALDPTPKRHPGIVAEAGELFFATARRQPFPFSFSSRGEIPRSRGLGSSASIRVGVLHALNRLAGEPLDAPSVF